MLPPKLRTIMAMLLILHDQVVPTSQFIDEIWLGDPPVTVVATMQTYIYQLRKLLGIGESGHEQGIALLRQVAARLHETERAPCLTAVAWLNWALGRSSVAGELVRRARKADGEYGFAELMETMLERGLLPDWAFRAGSVGSAGTIDRASRRRAR